MVDLIGLAHELDVGELCRVDVLDGLGEIVDIEMIRRELPLSLVRLEADVPVPLAVTHGEVEIDGVGVDAF